MNSFWVRLLLLAMIVAALGFYRVSPNKVKEQNLIAELQVRQSPGSIRVFQAASDSISFFSLGIPAAFFLAGLVRKRKAWIRKSLIVLLGIALGGSMSAIIKRTIREPRPYEVDARIAQLSVGGSNSFPSGHTVEATAAVIGITTLLVRTTWAAMIGAGWALLIMFSRIVLGVHNVTDVLAGVVLGCMGFLVIHEVFERKVSFGHD